MPGSLTALGAPGQAAPSPEPVPRSQGSASPAHPSMRKVRGERPSKGRGVDVYEGKFGPGQAERLLWRAGFGPRPGEVERARRARPAGRGRLARQPRPGGARRAAAARRQGAAARSRQRLGRRPLLVARPDGADLAAARRAHDAHLALVVRDLERGGRLAAADAEAERALPRRTRSDRSTGLLQDVTHDPAMLLWLNGAESVKEAPNENYGRELMECFTLGADRGAYTEIDVREQARSLTGWVNRWSKSSGPVDFHFDAAEHDDGIKTVFRQERRLRLAELLPSSASPIPSTPRSSSTSSGRTSSRRRPIAATLSGLTALVRRGLRGEAGRSGDPPPPRPLPRAADGEAAGRLHRRAPAPDRRRDHDDELGLDRPAVGPAALLPAERRRLGLHPLAQHRHVPRPLDGGGPGAAGPPAEPEPPARRASRPTRRRSSRTRSRSGATRRSRPRPRRSCSTSPRRALGDANADWEKQVYPTLVENALRQLIAVSPDLQTA